MGNNKVVMRSRPPSAVRDPAETAVTVTQKNHVAETKQQRRYAMLMKPSDAASGEE